MQNGFWFRTSIILITLSAFVFLLGSIGSLWSFIGDLILLFFLSYLVGSLFIHVVNELVRIPYMTRPFAILLIYSAFIALLVTFGFLVIPATVNQVVELAELVPQYVEQIPNMVNGLETTIARTGIELDLTGQIQVDSLNDFAETVATTVTANALGILQNVVSLLFGVVLVLVISFYIVLDGGRRLIEGLKVLPPKAEKETLFILLSIDETFHGYLRGMFLISLIYGVSTAGVMIATGLPSPLPVALVASILLAIPFVGDWLALALPLIVAAVAGNFTTFIIVLAVLLFIQQIMLNLLTPKILGQAVRMPAMLVIMSVVLGVRLAGVAGALLAVPTMGVLYGLAVHYGIGIRERREARDYELREKARRDEIEK